MQVMFNQLYNKDSISEKCTLRQLQVLINRQNIPTKVKDNASAVEDFIDVVVDAHILAAAPTYFGMDSIESIPTKNIDILAIASLPCTSQRVKLFEAVSHIVNEYVLHHVHSAVPTVSSKVPCHVVEEATPLSDLKQGEDYIWNYVC